MKPDDPISTCRSLALAGPPDPPRAPFDRRDVVCHRPEPVPPPSDDDEEEEDEDDRGSSGGNIDPDDDEGDFDDDDDDEDETLWTCRVDGDGYR